MDLLASLREFRRRHNGILIYLRLDEWPLDVPLPAGTRVVETGDGPFDPYWRFVLEPDRTIEAVVGWFIIPPPLDEAVAWYETEMAKRRWVRLAEEGHRLPKSAAILFRHPATNARVVVDLQTWTHRNETRAMIRRVVEHPWQPAEGESAGEPVSELTRVNGRRRVDSARLPAYTRSVDSTGVRRRQPDETAQVEEPERGEELRVAV